MAKQTGSIADRLAALERQTLDPRQLTSKGERDAMVAAWTADPANRERALAKLAPNDEHGRAAIEAAFRADR